MSFFYNIISMSICFLINWILSICGGDGNWVVMVEEGFLYIEFIGLNWLEDDILIKYVI